MGSQHCWRRPRANALIHSQHAVSHQFFLMVLATRSPEAGGRSHAELVPGITYSNCRESKGWWQQLPWSRGAGTSLRLLHLLSPSPHTCLLCSGSLQQITSPSAKFGHLYPMTAFTQQQTNHTPAWKQKWKSYTRHDHMI